MLNQSTKLELTINETWIAKYDPKWNISQLGWLNMINEGEKFKWHNGIH